MIVMHPYVIISSFIATVIQLKNIRVEHAQYTRERMALYPCTVIPNRNQRIRDFVSAGLAT